MHTEYHPDDQELSSIKAFIMTFLLALRNYALYPEDHSVRHKNLTSVQSQLDIYLAKHDNLHLDVEKDRLLFWGEVVHQGLPQEDHLPFLLHREGIQWIEFRNGITTAELNTFLNLLIQYKILREEAEGNLLTSLWENDLPHLKYKVLDILWDEFSKDLSTLKPAKSDSLQPEETVNDPAEPEETVDDTSSISKNINMPPIDATLWKLTPTEEVKLRSMVLEEGIQDSNEDVLKVITAILKKQHDPKTFTITLNFLIEEYQYNMTQGEFSFCVKCLENMDALCQGSLSEHPWFLQVMQYFRQSVSSPALLEILGQEWPQINVMGTDRLNDLRRMLLLLPIDVVFTLGSMLTTSHFPRIDHLMWEVFGIHASRDLSQLEPLLSKADEYIIQKIIQVLQNIEEKDPSEILFKLTRHSSDRVRKDAMIALMTRNPQNLKKLFSLIEDPVPSIRRQILVLLGRPENPLAEELLLDYLSNQRFKIKERQHILACYRSLGQCASSRSIPFLENSLLTQDWRAFLNISSSIHGQGAALALLAMKNEAAARACIQKASRSLNYSVRLSYRRAVKEDQRMRKESRH